MTYNMPSRTVLGILRCDRVCRDASVKTSIRTSMPPGGASCDDIIPTDHPNGRKDTVYNAPTVIKTVRPERYVRLTLTGASIRRSPTTMRAGSELTIMVPGRKIVLADRRRPSRGEVRLNQNGSLENHFYFYKAVGTRDSPATATVNGARQMVRSSRLIVLGK